MNIQVSEKGELELRDVFNSIILRIADEKFWISMHNRGFEFRYNGVDYMAKGGIIKTGGKKISTGKLNIKTAECKNCGQSIEYYFENEFASGWRHFIGDEFHYHCNLPDAIEKDIHAIPKIATEKPVSAIDQDLVVIKRNVEIAATFENVIPESSFVLSRSPWRLLSKIMQHRTQIAIQMLAAAKEPQDDGVMKVLHDAFDYDQNQIRQLLGMILPED